MKDSQLIDLFQRARKDERLAVIEGMQAVKHAVRFKAEIQEYIIYDIQSITDLLEELAPDVKDAILKHVSVVEQDVFNKLSPQPPRTGLIALAKRPNYPLNDIAPDKPIVFLEDPRDLENIGAVIRVAAAADAGAVIISGPAEIWHPAVIRGSAGLHWAIPVFSQLEASETKLKDLTSTIKQISKDDRGLIALDPTGENIKGQKIPNNAVLIFGTERHGISRNLLDQAKRTIRLPMKNGVSSLNLATSVAATLYLI